jgi:predicted amidohydrolase
MIAGPRGQIIARVDEEIEGYALARIDLDEVRRHREELQTIQSRQPSAYRAIVRQY